MGDVTIGKIENRAEVKGIDILAATKEISAECNSVSIKKACKKIVDVYEPKYVSSQPAKTVLSLISGFGYLDYLKKNYNDDYKDRTDNVSQIVEAASRFNDTEDGIGKYLQNISLVTSNDTETDENKVSFMTLHGSKGLEFSIVFLIGAENGILPHSRAIAENPENLAEERRLAYVGITRAKKLLYITYCKKRDTFGQWGNKIYKNATPSQFLYEAGLLKKEEENEQ